MPNIQVAVLDINETHISQWNSGVRLPIYEPGLLEIVQKQLGHNLVLLLIFIKQLIKLI